jgi:replicative DNA helicase
VSFAVFSQEQAFPISKLSAIPLTAHGTRRSNVRKLPEPAAPQFRSAPHNIEAEQAVLGAILVNNEAFYRVSDFLEPQHFHEPIHQQIYELASNLIRAGKIATPITVKTFQPPASTSAGSTPASTSLASRRKQRR